MRIVTWNMDHRGHSRSHDDAWRWLLEELRPDIALVQECIPPTWVGKPGRTVLFERAYRANRNWGTAIITTGLSSSKVRLDEVESWLEQLGSHASDVSSAARLEGWCVTASVELPGFGPILVSALHNPAFSIPHALWKDIDVSQIKLEMSRKLWLADVLFHFVRPRLAEPFLIGGDFNCSLLLDRPGRQPNREFFDRLQQGGFVGLCRNFHDQDQQTFFNPRCRAHQLDYFYADARTAQQASSCEVVPRAESAPYSDHTPLVLELAA